MGSEVTRLSEHKKDNYYLHRYALLRRIVFSSISPIAI